MFKKVFFWQFRKVLQQPKHNYNSMLMSALLASTFNRQMTKASCKYDSCTFASVTIVVFLRALSVEKNNKGESVALEYYAFSVGRSFCKSVAL